MSDSSLSAFPKFVVVGANGAYWRDYGDHYSMCPVSEDNDPVVPVALYVLEQTLDAERAASAARIAELEHVIEIVATGLDADRPALRTQWADTDAEWHKYAAGYLRAALSPATEAPVRLRSEPIAKTGEGIEVLSFNHAEALQFDGPVVIAQSDTDPGDMGEPRMFASDGVTHLTVPSFRLWGAIDCVLHDHTGPCIPETS